MRRFDKIDVLIVLLSCLLVVVAPMQLRSQSIQKIETIFDRRVTIIDSLLEVPEVSRLEEQLGLKGTYVDIGELKLWVETEGNGIPLVLVCGGPGTSHHYFHPHFKPASNFSKVIYYDLRGVGLSENDPANTYDVDQATNDLESLRKKLGIDRWVVLGLSFGGVIAQDYALKYPKRLVGMILVGSAVPMKMDVGLGVRQRDFQSEEEKNRIQEIYSKDGQSIVPVHSDNLTRDEQQKMIFNGFLNGDWKRRHTRKWTREDIAMYARYEFTHDKNYYFQMIEAWRKMDLTDCFLDCTIPTLIIEGKWDLAFGENKFSKFTSQFPNSQKEYFKNAGHLPFEDNPELFFSVLEDFIREVSDREPHNWRPGCKN